MRTQVRRLSPNTTLRTYATAIRGRPGLQMMPVVAEGTLLGSIDRERLGEIPQGYWHSRTVGEAMIPINALSPVAPATPISAVIPRFIVSGEDEQAPVPVVDEGRLVGLLDPLELQEVLELEDACGLLPHDTPAAPTEHEDGSQVLTTRAP